MKLFPFQKEGVEKMLSFLHTNKGVYLADEMGMGKSAQTLSALNSLLVGNETTLIVCPSVMKYTWEDEIKIWSNRVLPKIKVYEKSSELKASPPEGDFIIISYDLVSRKENLKELLKVKYGALILDEAHYLKSLDTNRTIACLMGLWVKATYKIALSGTPFLQSVADGFPLFSRLSPSDFPTFKDYVSKYVYVSEIPVGGRFGRTIFVPKYHGVKNEKELSTIIRSKFFVRRRKEEVLKDLPPKIYTKVPLPDEYLLKVAKSEEERLKESVSIVKNAIEKDIPPPPVPVALATQRKAQALKKLPPIVEFTKNLLDQKIPTVVFLYHRDVIEKFTNDLKQYEPYVITGDTPSKLRSSFVKDFQEREERNLFILQIKAGGVGITLHRSSTVILGELDWSPGTIAQAIDRVHRIGQKAATINIYYFGVNGSIEADIESTVVRKASEFSKVINESKEEVSTL